jgi:cell wall-associated NlpC family hydrolase
MIIKRGFLFITIALLLLFPWHVFGASPKNLVKKNNPTVSKKVSHQKSPPAQLRAQKKSKSTLTAKKSRSHKTARRKHSHHLAQENPIAPQDAPPLLKITPLDNGKFLLEPMDSSSNSGKGSESLSLIKKPIFDEGIKQEETGEENKNPLSSFSNLIVKISKQLLGKSYRMGGNGNGNEGIDCSGFMKKIYQTLTLSLPHSSREQAKLGSLVTTEWDLSRLKIGDLLFFKRNRGKQIGHTGMYIGEGQMIHSSSSQKGVVISNLRNSDYYNRNFVMAKRLFIFDNPQVDEFKEFKGTKETHEPQQTQVP